MSVTRLSSVVLTVTIDFVSALSSLLLAARRSALLRAFCATAYPHPISAPLPHSYFPPQHRVYTELTTFLASLTRTFLLKLLFSLPLERLLFFPLSLSLSLSLSTFVLRCTDPDDDRERGKLTITSSKTIRIRDFLQGLA